MKLFKIEFLSVPLSIRRQSQAFNEAEEVEHEEVFTERELTPYEVKKVNQHQAWATRQLKNFYLELNPAVKEAKS